MNEYHVIDSKILDGLITSGNIRLDSREVSRGDVFIAAKGTRYDGHDFIPDVAKKDPALIICEHFPDSLKGYSKDKILKVEDSLDMMGYIARCVYNDPASRMETYGVTGTNGKTTTVFLINAILEKADKKCGFISTVKTKISSLNSERSSMTTPGVFDVYALLDQMAEKGNDAAIVEVSSHALDQKRVCGLRLNTAVFTNITPEHMDYHKNMDAYFSAKTKILDLLKPRARAVLNADDPLVATLDPVNAPYSCITFGIENKADIMAHDIKMSGTGTKFVISVRKEKLMEVRTGLIGKHNVYNTLAAISAVMDRDVPLPVIVSALEKAAAPPGRLEPVILNDPFSVYIDYAHTPNALENVLVCLRKIAKRDLICVFGCGGDRDKSKRPAMGKIASSYCDRVIITSDNPRSEDPMEIISQIEKGIKNTSLYLAIKDRAAAITAAISFAVRDDIIVIAGKGHEDYQILGDVKIHFDDKEIVERVLKKD